MRSQLGARTASSREHTGGRFLRRSPATFILLVAVSMLVVLPTLPATAASGDLDTTFDLDGKVTTDLLGDNEGAFRVDVRPNGMLVVTGCSGCFPTVSTDFAAAQYKSDGSIDPSFGTSGVATVDFGQEDPLSSSALQSDGKVVLVGSTTEPYNPATRDYALARLNEDGSLDSSFGTAGKVTTDVGADDQPNDVVLQADGKIVVVGTTNVGGRRFALVRYDTDGSLDTSFGTGGSVVTNVGGADQIIRAAVIQDDGMILAAGFDGADVVVARYTTDGSLDASFGSGGIVRTDIAGAGRDLAFAVNIVGDDAILIGGLANDTDFALLRYNPDGTLDTTFGTNGLVTTDFGHGQDIIYRMAELADGRYLAIGEARAPERVFGLAMYNPNGSLDNAFGSGGLVTTSFGGDYAVARGLAIQPDGKAVVAGVTVDTAAAGANQDFAVARYLVSGPDTCTIVGTSGNDVLRGTAGDDVICGLEGDDTLEGLAGDDVLIGGPGNDLLAGNAGNDKLSGHAGDDTLFGGPGDDLLAGGGGADLLRGGDDNDELHGSAGTDTLIGDAGDDELWGGSGADSMQGRAGHDTLKGGTGSDHMAGNHGNDMLFGQADSDTLIGGPGHDTLSGGGDSDLLRGGDGADKLHGREGNDKLVGGADDDRMWGGSGEDLIEGRTGKDTLRGGTESDVLAGNRGNDTLFGNAGDDTLFGGPGIDLCNGGTGDDALVDCSQVGANIDGEAAGDQAGLAVGMSSDGTAVIVGAPMNDGAGENAGQARVYRSDGSSWAQVGDDIDGEAAGDLAGSSVAMSNDGSTVIVGAPRNDGNGDIAGHARIFRWDGSAWNQVGADIDGATATELMGSAVAMSSDGNTVGVGAPGGSGQARVYTWDGITWTQVGADIAGSPFDVSGTAVAMSSDGNTVIVGATSARESRVYRYDGSAWMQMGATIEDEAALSGWSVAMSSDGDTVAIGTLGADTNGAFTGRTRVFNFDGSAWLQVGSDINGESGGDQFGMSVAVDSSGDTVVIGAPLSDAKGADAGRTSVYRLDGGVWTQVGHQIDGAAPAEWCGRSVAISADGNTITVGVPRIPIDGVSPGHVQVYSFAN